MSTLTAIRDAIKTTLEANITGLWVYDTVPDAVQLPCVIVKPTTGNFAQTFGRGTDSWSFDLEVLVQLDDIDLAQDRLDAYVNGSGSSSLRQVIFQNRTLGLSDTNAAVLSMSSYGTQNDVAGVPHLGAALELTVLTSGTA